MEKRVSAAIEKMTRLYADSDSTLRTIVETWNGKDPGILLKRLGEELDNLDAHTRAFVATVVRPVVLSEYRTAERTLKLPPLQLTPQAEASISGRLYQTFRQQTATVRAETTRLIEEGWKQGQSLEDRRHLQKMIRDKGIVGLKRSDGSTLSLKATGKAMVRTRVNQLQAESQLDRYRQANVQEVEYMSGGRCTFAGEGGTCQDLDGERFPIDDIPDWAQIPRHLYSQSRWVAVSGAETGEAAQTDPETVAAPEDDAQTPTEGLQTESLVARSPALRHFTAGVDAIRRVHNPAVTLRFGGSSRIGKDSYGHYKYGGRPNSGPGTIAVRNYIQGDRTVIHEAGHAIDHQLYGRAFSDDWNTPLMGSRYAHKESSPLNAWWKAAQSTGYEERIREKFSYDRKFRDYVLGPEEVWARSYEQWIALRSGDNRLKKMYEDKSAHYWEWDNFEPIAKELDRLFQVKP